METVTRTAEDYLKAIWSALEWGGVPATVKDLADRFGITPAAGSSTVKRLVGQGLLRHVPYGPILLTAEGEALALKMVRRHRLLETYLVDQLGYSWDEVHNEAENLEHAASDLLINRIDDLLGNPSVDPHGDPIPNRSGAVSYPVGARRLSVAEPGGYRVSRICDDSPALLEWCENAGVGRDTFVTVRQHADGVTGIILDGAEVSLPNEKANEIIVLPT